VGPIKVAPELGADDKAQSYRGIVCEVRAGSSSQHSESDASDFLASATRGKVLLA